MKCGARLGLAGAVLAGFLVGCQADAVTAPFGLEVDERVELGPVAAAIRNSVLNQPVCPLVPTAARTDWTVHDLSRPPGRILLPAGLQAVAAPTGEVTFFAPDMSAGAFVQEAAGLASLDVPENSTLSQSAMVTCQLRLEQLESLVYLISQPHPVRRGDSVHLAFVQVAGTGHQAWRAGAFATTRALRDSLVGALLAFQAER
jgi:hypothetical protein